MSEIALIIIVALAFPVMTIAALVAALGARNRIRDLQDRVARLEAGQAATRAIAAATAVHAPPPPVVEEAPAPGTEEEPAAAEPPVEPAEAASSRHRRSQPPEPAPPTAIPATAAGTVTGGTLRHPMGGVDRRAGAGARRRLPGALHGRARPARARRAHLPRRLFAAALIAAGEWTRRNEIAAGIAAIPGAAHPQHPHRGRHGRGLCHGLCGLRALRFSVAGRRLHPARHRGAGDVGRRAAARAGARRPRPCRRLSRAGTGGDERTELLGAVPLSHRRQRGRLRAGAHAAVALACHHRRGARRAVGSARHHKLRRRGARRASLLCRRRICDRRRAHRLRTVVRPRRRARRDRRGLVRRARRLSDRGSDHGDAQPPRHRRPHRLHAAHGGQHRRRLAHRRGAAGRCRSAP